VWQRSHHTEKIIHDVSLWVKEKNVNLLYGNMAPMLVLESKAQAVFMHPKMGDFARWHFPGEFYGFMYVVPEKYHEMDALYQMTQKNFSKTLLKSWPIFPEKNDRRRIGLYHFKR
jgi:hypothetical protein